MQVYDATGKLKGIRALIGPCKKLECGVDLKMRSELVRGGDRQVLGKWLRNPERVSVL